MIFNQGTDFDYFGNNFQSVLDINEEIKKEDNLILSFILNDLPLTKKFVEYYKIYRNFKKKYIDTTNRTDALDSYDYNWYIPPSEENIRIAKAKMNNVITELNALSYKISDNLKLNLNLNKLETDKLNSLHFIFENEIANLFNTNKIRERNLFEKINQIVHFIENASFNEAQRNQYSLVIRPINYLSYKDLYVKLVDEDYRDFQEPKSGNLICDFATVGKDLWACAKTNDVNLIEKKEVKQQEYLTDYVSIFFSSALTNNDSNFKNEYYEWCQSNFVDRYIDYRQPKYNPGRHILGEIDSTDKNADWFYNSVISKYPKFVASYLLDDEDNLIY